MSTKPIEQGNELIAEFMGENIGEAYDLFGADNYDLNWNRLMPVVEKIHKMKHDPNEMFMGTTLERHVEFSRITSALIITPIGALWQAIVEFIEWYNKLLPLKAEKQARYNTQNKQP